MMQPLQKPPPPAPPGAAAPAAPSPGTELPQLEQRLATIITNFPIVLWALDRDGRFTMSEGKGLEPLGLAPGELVGRPITEVYGDFPEIIEYNRRALAGESFSATVRVGELVYDAWYSPLRDARGQITGMLGVALDTSRSHRLEQQLLHAQKMEAIGRLAGGIAHDFNNLLTVIGGYTELMLGQVAPHEPFWGDLEEVRGATQQAMALTQRLLTFVRRPVLRPGLLDLNALVAAAKPVLQRLIGEDITLVTRPGPSLRRIRGDPGQIQQMLLNLAVNARDAMPTGGTLVIETANAEAAEAWASGHVGVAPGEYVMLSVSDSGVGMDREIRSRIFEPFFTTKAEARGAGLGLSTVYGIVQQHRGHVWVYSESGRGATFKVYLPSERQDAAREQPTAQRGGARAEPHPERTRAPDNPATVLVIDDEDAVRRVTRRILEKGGFTVLEADRGDAALRLLGEHAASVDIVVTDVVLPDTTGPELARRIRDRGAHLPILFMSGYTETVLGEAALDPEAEFLEKPFTPQKLIRKVRELLGEPLAS